MLDNELSRVKSLGAGGIHLVGQSWGGLLALAFIMDHPGVVEKFTLIAPGIFPLAKSRNAGLKAIFRSTLQSSNAMHKSAWQPDDFSAQSSVVSMIAADPLRVTALSAATLRTTARLMLQVRKIRSAKIKLPSDSLCLLGEDDGIIDSLRTRRFMEKIGIPCAALSGGGHALALEQPRWVAERILRR